MSDDNDRDNQQRDRSDPINDPPSISNASVGRDGNDEGGDGTKKQEKGKKPKSWFPKNIKAAEWIMISFTAVTAGAAIVTVFVAQGQLNAMVNQLDEMRDGSRQTDNIIALHADQNGTLRFQSARIDRLATDVRREADSTQRLADTTDKQLVAIKATSDSTKAEADALKSQLAVQQATLSNTYSPRIEITPIGVEDILIKNGMLSTGIIYSVRNIGNRPANNMAVWINFIASGVTDSSCQGADAMGNMAPPLKVGGVSTVSDHPLPISVKDIAGKIPRVLHSDRESYMTINPMVVGCVSYISPTDRIRRHITFTWVIGASRFPSHVFDTLDDGIIPRNEVTIGVRASAED